MADTTINLGGSFPVVKFDQLPSGMEKGKGRIGRTKYDWGVLGIKEGYTVPGNIYSSAQSSATTFAKNHPFDDDQQKKLDAHMRGRKLSALKAFKKEIEEAGQTWDDALWTEEKEKAVTPDPDFLKENTRVFASVAVRDGKGKLIKTKGYGKNGELADQYHIIRVQ